MIQLYYFLIQLCFSFQVFPWQLPLPSPQWREILVVQSLYSTWRTHWLSNDTSRRFDFQYFSFVPKHVPFYDGLNFTYHFQAHQAIYQTITFIYRYLDQILTRHILLSSYLLMLYPRSTIATMWLPNSVNEPVRPLTALRKFYDAHLLILTYCRSFVLTFTFLSSLLRAI